MKKENFIFDYVSKRNTPKDNYNVSARVFHEYAQKYDLLREKPFDGKIEGLDAAVIVL